MSKSFIAVGDYLINPQLLAYAFVDPDNPEPRLRVGFASTAATGAAELSLTGDQAGELLRWLRLNATFLTKGGGVRLDRQRAGNINGDPGPLRP